MRKMKEKREKRLSKFHKIAQKLDQILGCHKTGIELLKIAHEVDSAAIPLRIINTALKVLSAFLALFLTARLVDALLSEDFEKGLLLAGILAFSRLVFGVVGQLVAMAYAKSAQRCVIAFDVMMRRKAISLDYETTEQPEVSDRIFTAERTADMYGGLGTVVSIYQGLLESVLNIVTALGLIGALCLARPDTESRILGFLAAPGISALCCLGYSLITILTYRKTNADSLMNEKEYLGDHVGKEMQLSYLLDRVMSNLQAAKVIRIYDMKKVLTDNVKKVMSQCFVFYGGMCDLERKKSLGQNLANGFFVAASYLFVAVKVLAGAITIGAFTQYTGALAKLSEGFLSFAANSAGLSRCCTYMTDFLELIHMENRHGAGTIPVEKRLDGDYEIEFRDVSFHYPGSQEMILQHVNFKFTIGNKLALVGKNGAGKTTFIKLLCRLYEPTEGMITLNGIDIRKYREEEYRELFGVVFQDFKLFAFPLWKNLAAGYQRQDEKLWDSIERAGATDFVKGLPQGLDTLLLKDKEGGVDISGGEAQKLALARALYKDAPFVVLDEPTAALDPISEAAVYAGFHEMVKDKTSIYISHRMSSCRFCDDIVVFEDGRIVERGSHEQLLAAGGSYARMWEAQARYYT